MPEKQQGQAENPYTVLSAELPGAQAAEQSRPTIAGQPASQQPPLPAAQVAVASQAAIGSAGQPGSAGMPAIADDVDLIEKEWIAKAKEIVERTKDDPRQQNAEMNKVKADYIQKRYGKEIKVSES